MARTTTTHESHESTSGASQPAVVHTATTPTSSTVRTYLPWLISAGAVVVLLIIGTLLLGMSLGRHESFRHPGMFQGQGYPYGGGRTGFHRMGIAGTVTGVSSSSITIKTTDGTSKTFSVTSSTVVRKTDRSTGSISDVPNGANVVIRSLDPSAANPVAASIMLIDATTTNSMMPPVQTN